MKDVESWGKQFHFPRSAFHSQRSDHHVRSISEEGLHPSHNDLSLEWPEVDTLPHHNQLIDAPLWKSPLAPSTRVSAPSEVGTAAPNQQERSRATLVVDHGVASVYLALSDDIDYSANSAGPHNQRDPPSELRLIGHHQEHCVFIISCDTSHLHAQDDKPKWASMFPT